MRVPFGLRLSDNQWVGPEDVDGGLACGCICPYCKLPLKKNVCKTRSNHFSHHTRQQQEKVKERCEYSFWVALASMARMILSRGGEMCTPSYEKAVQYPAANMHNRGNPVSRAAKITTPGVIRYTEKDITIGEVFEETLTDAVIRINGLTIIIALVHPERDGSWADAIKGDGISVLVVDLSGLAKVYASLRGSESFKEQIHTHLFDKKYGKKWVLHHREERYCAKAQEEAQDEWEKMLTDAERLKVVAASKKTGNAMKERSDVGVWRDILCDCGNVWRDFISDASLKNLYCPSCRQPATAHGKALPKR